MADKIDELAAEAGVKKTATRAYDIYAQVGDENFHTYRYWGQITASTAKAALAKMAETADTDFAPFYLVTLASASRKLKAPRVKFVIEDA